MEWIMNDSPLKSWGSGTLTLSSHRHRLLYIEMVIMRLSVYVLNCFHCHIDMDLFAWTFQTKKYCLYFVRVFADL